MLPPSFGEKQKRTSSSFKVRNLSQSCSVRSQKRGRTKALLFFFFFFFPPSYFSLWPLNTVLSCGHKFSSDISSLFAERECMKNLTSTLPFLLMDLKAAIVRGRKMKPSLHRKQITYLCCVEIVLDLKKKKRVF